jgi:hypothetical protein
MTMRGPGVGNRGIVQCGLYTVDFEVRSTPGAGAIGCWLQAALCRVRQGR